MARYCPILCGGWAFADGRGIDDVAVDAGLLGWH